MNKKKTITISLNEGDRENLEKLAENLGILWGDSGSISGILQAISSGHLKLIKGFDENEIQLQLEALKSLIKDCKISQALKLIDILSPKIKDKSDLCEILSFPEYPHLLFIERMDVISIISELQLIKIPVIEIKYKWIDNNLFIEYQNNQYKIIEIKILTGEKY